MGSAMAVPGLHRASRPSWVCEDCGQPWPCTARKAMVLDERPFDRMAALLFLSRLMHDAIEDFARDGACPVPDLYKRFLSFLHRVEPDAADLAESNGVASPGPSRAGTPRRREVEAGLDGGRDLSSPVDGHARPG